MVVEGRACGVEDSTRVDLVVVGIGEAVVVDTRDEALDNGLGARLRG
jgi:hypothetical protein